MNNQAPERSFAIVDGDGFVIGIQHVDEGAEPDPPAGAQAHLLGAFPVAPPERPNFPARLVLVDGSLEWEDSRTLAEAKVNRIALMRDARDAKLFGGFEWDGSTFDSDMRAQSTLLGMFTTAALATLPDTPFRLADNSWRVLTAADMPVLWSALQAHIGGAFSQFAAREYAINSASTNLEVDTVVWDA